ncbi:MAG: hypothetical protein WD739_07615 [Actinomycetota bacterium]
MEASPDAPSPTNLSKLGWNDVVLLEKGELTSGWTWHAAGVCTQFNASLHLSRLLMRGFRAESRRPFRLGLAKAHPAFAVSRFLEGGLE